MIELPRSLARRFRAVLRQCGTPTEPAREAPVVRCRAGAAGLALEAKRSDVAVRWQAEGSRPDATLAVPATLLAQIEGRTDEPVTLEQVKEGTGQARWTEDGAPRTVSFELAPPESVPPFPEAPRRFAAMPPEFAAALAEAIRSTARDSVRYALTRVQLRGQDGALIGTDGRQLLLHQGFALPWSEELLVPAIAALAGKEFLNPERIGLGRTKTHVALRQGPWTFLLAIDRDGRFPNIEHVIPKGTTNRLRLDPEDAAAAIAVLGKSQGKIEEQPVTLDLDSPPAIRFRVNEGPVTEVALPRSTATGKPVRVASDRRFLLRALQLGFTEIHVRDADAALCCRDAQRTYVWMPLGKNAVLAPSAEVLRVPVGPDSEPAKERNTTMPNPSTNGHRSNDDERRSPAPLERPGLEELISEAEALRTQLADATQRTTRLVAALKQQRRHSRVLRSAIDSLRELKLGP